jgi:hypothetical protein
MNKRFSFSNTIYYRFYNKENINHEQETIRRKHNSPIHEVGKA